MKKTLLQAIDDHDEPMIEAIMEQIIQLAATEGLTVEEVTDILAAHDILPGSGFFDWIYQELSHQLDVKNPDAPKLLNKSTGG